MGDKEIGAWKSVMCVCVCETLLNAGMERCQIESYQATAESCAR